MLIVFAGHGYGRVDFQVSSFSKNPGKLLI
jgi:hypothetical protein